MPPLIPAAKLRPVRPSTTTMPPVMYSQPWSPTPSTTAEAPGVAHREALAGEPAEERLAGRRAVEHRVADDDALLGREPGVVGRTDAERAAGEPLADVVVRVADERELDAGCEPGAERLARRAGQRDADRAVGQPVPAVRDGDVVGEQPADRAVDVADRERHLDRLAALERRRGGLDQLPVERVGERRVLRAHPPHRRSRRARRGGRAARSRSIPRSFHCAIASSASSRSTRPTRSS